MSERSERLLARMRENYGDPTQELHQRYSPWLDDMSTRPGNALVPFDFDLEKHPEQSVEVPVTPSDMVHPHVPDSLFYKAFQIKMAKSLGFTTMRALLNQINQQSSSSYDPTKLPKRLAQDQATGKNTLVVSSHFKFQELGYFRALEFIAKEDRQRLGSNGVLLNKLMSRQAYRGKPLAQHFSPVGEVLWSYPQSKNSEKYQIPTGASRLGNALFMDALQKRTQQGGYELHAALTGSEIKPISDDSNKFSHYLIPDIHNGSAKLIESFDNALPVTMAINPKTEKWEARIGELLDIAELLKTNTVAEVTDMIYGDITESVEQITKKDVVYNKLAPLAGKAALKEVVAI